MKAIFLILFVFSTLMIMLGYTARTENSSALSNALIFGAISIYIGMITTWLLFKLKERSEVE